MLCVEAFRLALIWSLLELEMRYRVAHCIRAQNIGRYKAAHNERACFCRSRQGTAHARWALRPAATQTRPKLRSREKRCDRARSKGVCLSLDRV